MKKKLLSVLMAAVMVAGVGGVGAAQVKADDEKILGAGIYSASDNFNSYIGKAITNACDGIFKTNIEDGQNDQSTQNNQVDTMLAKGASAVAVSVCDVTAAPTLIQKCKDAGNVPIIFFNKEITDYDVINSYENAYQVTSTGGDYGASIQAQMVNLFRKLQKEQGFSFLFIAHDLSMVKFLCDRTGVMYRGRLVEEGTTKDVFSHPEHEYTKALLAAIPVPDPRKERNRRVMKCYEG